MSPRSGRRLRILLAFIALLLSADAAAWLWTADRLTAAAENWRVAQAGRGISISASPPARGGWPLGVSLTWPQMAIDAPAAGLAWRGGPVIFAAGLLHPAQASLRLAGPQTLRLAGLPPLSITADRLELAVRIGAHGQAEAGELTAEGLRLAGDGRAMGVGQLSLRANSDPAGTHLALHASAISLPATPPALLGLDGWPLGAGIARLGLDASLSGGLPPAPAATAAWMRAWHEAGGGLTIEQLMLNWGPLDLSARAALSADPTGQPIASLRGELGGWAATADALAAAGLVSAQALRPAKTLLSLMAHTDAPGGPSLLTLPLTLQDGRLSMGRVPLAELAPLP